MQQRVMRGKQRVVAQVLRELGETPRVVLVENGQLFINDVPVRRDETTQQMVLQLLHERLMKRRDWVEVGPIMLSLHRRRFPVMLVLGEESGNARVQIRLAFGRNCRFFVRYGADEARELAARIETRRCEINGESESERETETETEADIDAIVAFIDGEATS